MNGKASAIAFYPLWRSEYCCVMANVPSVGDQREVPVVVLGGLASGSQGGGKEPGGFPVPSDAATGLAGSGGLRTGGLNGGDRRSGGWEVSLVVRTPRWSDFAISKEIEEGVVLMADNPADPGGQGVAAKGGWCLVGPRKKEKVDGRRRRIVTVGEWDEADVGYRRLIPSLRAQSSTVRLVVSSCGHWFLECGLGGVVAVVVDVIVNEANKKMGVAVDMPVASLESNGVGVELPDPTMG